MFIPCSVGTVAAVGLASEGCWDAEVVRRVTGR